MLAGASRRAGDQRGFGECFAFRRDVSLTLTLSRLGRGHALRIQDQAGVLRSERGKNLLVQGQAPATTCSSSAGTSLSRNASMSSVYLKMQPRVWSMTA